MTRRLLLAAAVAWVAMSLRGAGGRFVQAATAAAPPPRLTGAAFWRLVEEMSEPGGPAGNDNLVSNEQRFQSVGRMSPARVESPLSSCIGVRGSHK